MFDQWSTCGLVLRLEESAIVSARRSSRAVDCRRLWINISSSTHYTCTTFYHCVRVMAWCHQATSRYMRKCWQQSISPWLNIQHFITACRYWLGAIWTFLLPSVLAINVWIYYYIDYHRLRNTYIMLQMYPVSFLSYWFRLWFGAVRHFINVWIYYYIDYHRLRNTYIMLQMYPVISGESPVILVQVMAWCRQALHKRMNILL